MKNKNTVTILAFFFWYIGIHRFYLWQKVVWAILVLLCLCFPLVALLVWFIDFLNFLLMSKKWFNKLYNSWLKQCKSCLEYVNAKAKLCKYCWDILNK